MTDQEWGSIVHFDKSEFVCPCCGRADMDFRFMRALDSTRQNAGVPFVVTSGFRCEKHNFKVGGEENSAHLRGTAADVRVQGSLERMKIVRTALAVGFRRVGIGTGFVHLDLDDENPQDVMWVYL